jgi:hypothetical protein
MHYIHPFIYIHIHTYVKPPPQKKTLEHPTERVADHRFPSISTDPITPIVVCALFTEPNRGGVKKKRPSSYPRSFSSVSPISIHSLSGGAALPLHFPFGLWVEKGGWERLRGGLGRGGGKGAGAYITISGVGLGGSGVGGLLGCHAFVDACGHACFACAGRFWGSLMRPRPPPFLSFFGFFPPDHFLEPFFLK